MDSPVPRTSPQGLPPVAPPSGRFIAQLFLVPGMIVLAAVLLLLLFRFVVGGGYTPAHFLSQLDNGNADIRWRGANDLAQVLEKPDHQALALRCNVTFALDLTERLRVAWNELVHEEEKQGPFLEKLARAKQELGWRKLNPQRDYVRFLIVAVARSNAPVALPVLADIALRDQSPDVKGLTLVRRQALWALGILGQNVHAFPDLPAESRDAILQDLSQEADAGEPHRAAWAKYALHAIAPSRFPSPPENVIAMNLPVIGATTVGLLGSPLGQGPFLAALALITGRTVAMDQVLARCAKAEDQYLREQVALALLFYDGPLVAPTLQKLARDSGHGTLVRVKAD